MILPARADIVLSIEHAKVVPGEVASVGVFATATGGSGLDAFDLPIDIGRDGRGFPAGISGFAGTDFVDEKSTFMSAVAIKGLVDLAMPAFVQNYEAILSDSGTRLTPFDSSKLLLFNVLVQTDTSFTGTTPVAVTSNSLPLQFNVVTSDGTFKDSGLVSQLIVRPGSITAVPEPSSLVLLGLLGTAIGLNQYLPRIIPNQITRR